VSCVDATFRLQVRTKQIKPDVRQVLMAGGPLLQVALHAILVCMRCLPLVVCSLQLFHCQSFL
jgi:hypothetical protein